jgi:flavin-binding protein dodecin
MAVARVTEVVASSKKSWEDAAITGFKRASKTLRGITGFEVIKQSAHV